MTTAGTRYNTFFCKLLSGNRTSSADLASLGEKNTKRVTLVLPLLGEGLVISELFLIRFFFKKIHSLIWYCIEGPNLRAIAGSTELQHWC